MVKRNEKTGDTKHAGVYLEDGKHCVADPYHVIRLAQPLTSLPQIDKPFNTGKIIGDIERHAEGLVALPTVADVKAHIAKHKATGSKAPAVYALHINTWKWYCKAEYLLDILQALPDCRAWKPKDQLSGMLFGSEDWQSDALLMPVRPPREDCEAAD